MTDYEFIAKHAEYVAGGALDPIHSRQEYEDAMLAMAKAEALQSESPEQALVRLMDDPRMVALAGACRRLEVAKAKAAADQRRADVESGRAGEAVRRVCEDRERSWDRMQEMAKRGRRDGETEEKAMDRMLREDPAMQAAYQEHSRGA